MEGYKGRSIGYRLSISPTSPRRERSAWASRTITVQSISQNHFGLGRSVMLMVIVMVMGKGRSSRQKEE